MDAAAGHTLGYTGVAMRGLSCGYPFSLLRFAIPDLDRCRVGIATSQGCNDAGNRILGYSGSIGSES